MNDTKAGKKDKGQHIQVFVRVKPLSAAEAKCASTVEIPNDKEIVILERPHEKFSKKFKFDNVFGPSSRQVDVYNIVVGPLLDQVLAGYNCTVFAYGQTGTGKTFTMEGTNNDPTLHWQSDSSSGMIPRALSHLFDKLQLLEAQEYTIRVSFLELYNEDLFDLLSPSDDGSKIRLYEDTSRKGAVIIHGLEEITIHNKSEVYKILESGSEKRQTGATLMNTQSSRSHTVFSITVHLKENTIDGEDVLKTGKINLVDLAGSENVGRSGAVDRRAREAGSINQSLLTLGRVITALVERAPHVPYRESKLTRLLQESLGGRTKTSIIATISPASINLEETLSTLDYAHRAKNITNRPEINQKLSKKEFLKQYTEEIERLRGDLLATRERNGIYLANESYSEMQAQINRQNKEIEEKINHIKAIEKNMQEKEKVFTELQSENIAQTKELQESKMKLDTATDALRSTINRLKLTIQKRDEQKYLLEKHVQVEQSLLEQAKTLVNVADTATEDSHKLHDKIARKDKTEKTYEVLGEEFKNNVCTSMQQIEQAVLMFGQKMKHFGLSIKDCIDKQTSTQCEGIGTAIHQINTDLSHQHFSENNLTKTVNESYSYQQNWLKNDIKNAVETMNSQSELLNTLSMTVSQNINNIIENEIASQMQCVRNSVIEKLTRTKEIMKEMIDSACAQELKKYNNIKANLANITKDIERLHDRQQPSEKEHLFAKMIGDVYSQFNILQKNQQEHYSAVTTKCNSVSKICNEVQDHVKNIYDTNVTTHNSLRERIASDIDEIENDVTLGTKLNEDLAIKSTKQGHVLINELNANMNGSCKVLDQYKNLIEYNIAEMQSKIDANRNEALSLLDNAHANVVTVNKSHTELMENKKMNISQDLEEVCTKLEDQFTKSSMRNKEIIEKLQNTEIEIKEFFDKDLKRDVPTGQTPARKEFSYPREFKVTSPHDRILQRFRESRKSIDSTEGEDYADLSSEITLKQVANSTTLSDATFVLSPHDSTLCDTNPWNRDSVSKHAVSRTYTESNAKSITEALDASSVSMQLNEQWMRDTISENKENDNCNILTQNMSKRTKLSKFK